MAYAPTLSYLVDHSIAPFSAARPAWSKWDDETVARMRSLRASWDGVAKALGRPTPDVRKRYDPAWGDPAEGEASAPVALAAVPRPTLSAPKLAAVRVEVLLAVRDHALRTGEVATHLGKSLGQIGGILAELRAKGLIDKVESRDPWRITARGERRLREALA